VRRMQYWRYEPTRPIPVKGGIKARSQRGAIGKSWWAQLWMEALGRIMDFGRLERGRSYARRGQVLDIHEHNGEIRAKVQGSRPTPYQVRIRLTPLSDAQWKRVFDRLAQEALFTAQLLSGEMPREIEKAFLAAGTHLFPTSIRELHTECSCPDWANPCKHVAAVYILIGEALDDNPFLLFRLRGRTQEHVLSELRARRAEEAGERPAEGLERTAQEAPQHLPEDPLSFWTLEESLEDFAIRVDPPEIPLGLLQHLGDPPFVSLSLRTLLAPIYEGTTQKARSLALTEDRARAPQASFLEPRLPPDRRWHRRAGIWNMPGMLWKKGNPVTDFGGVT